MRERKLEALAAGVAAEQAVGVLLREQGWDILARNWRCKLGELDLVVRKGAWLRFVEVKLRQADDLAGLACVDWQKVRKVRRAAELWLNDYTDLFDEACLMVALVTPDPDGTLQIELFDDPD